MRHRRRVLVLVTARVLRAVLTPRATAAPRFAVLVFAKIKGYCHDAIPAGRRAIAEPGADHGFEAVASDDAGVGTDAALITDVGLGLARFTAVVRNARGSVHTVASHDTRSYPGERSPTATTTACPSPGRAPLSGQLTDRSTDPDGGADCEEPLVAGGVGACEVGRSESALPAARASGARIVRNTTGGGLVSGVVNGDRLCRTPVDPGNVGSLRFRVAAGANGGTIEVRCGAPDGPSLGSVAVPVPRGGRTWTEVTAPVVDPGSSHRSFLSAGNPGATGDLSEMDSFEFPPRSEAAARLGGAAERHEKAGV